MSRAPSKNFTPVVQLGLKAHRLATDNDIIIERLPAGTINGLASDIQLLGALVPGARQAYRESLTATATQNGELADAFELVSSIRAAVNRTSARFDVKRAYGVGQVLNPKIVAHVVAALNDLITRIAAYPEEARSLGILDRDTVALQGLLERVQSSNNAQELRRAGAPVTTRVRNQAARRIMMAVHRIASAGIIEFARSPQRRDFEALLEGPRERTTPAILGDSTAT